MSITQMPPAKAKGARFEHGSVLGGKTQAAWVSSQWKSTRCSHSLQAGLHLISEGVDKSQDSRQSSSDVAAGKQLLEKLTDRVGDRLHKRLPLLMVVHPDSPVGAIEALGYQKIRVP